MVSLGTIALASGGIVLTVGVFALVHWDANRVGVRRPRLWASIAAGTCLAGVILYVFVPTAPLTGVILTANTGPVLYGFEREVSREGSDPADPGWIPGEPTESPTKDEHERKSDQ